VAELGEPRAGMSVLCEGLRIAEVTGSEVYKPHWLALLANVQASNGPIDEARCSIEEALEMADRAVYLFVAVGGSACRNFQSACISTSVTFFA
jgi:hypothetical protein